jgi:regulator of replication initiation timing
MKTSEKIKNMTYQMSTVIPAMKHLNEIVSDLERENDNLKITVADLNARLSMAQSRFIKQPTPTRTAHTDVQNFVSSLASEWQISDGIVWGLVLDILRNSKITNPIQPLPAPNE